MKTDGDPTIPAEFNPGKSKHPYTDMHGMWWEQDEKRHWWFKVRITPQLHNPNHVLHGGVLFTLADTAMGRTVTAALQTGEECASIEVRIHHLRMVNEGVLRAHAYILHKGRRIIVLEAEVFDDKDRLVSKASGTMYIIHREKA